MFRSSGLPPLHRCGDVVVSQRAARAKHVSRSALTVRNQKGISSSAGAPLGASAGAELLLFAPPRVLRKLTRRALTSALIFFTPSLSVHLLLVAIEKFATAVPAFE